MADPKRSSKSSPKQEKREPRAEVVAPTLTERQKAKAARIARQEEAAERNRQLRAAGKLTPFEEARALRKKQRKSDPLVQARAKRLEQQRIRDENARRLAKAEAEEKAATPIIQKIHEKAGV